MSQKPDTTAPSSDTRNGETYRGTVNLLPISAGDPVWVGQDGADSDLECYMTDDYIAQVGDRVLYIKEGRHGIILGKIAPQPGWFALSPYYATNITDFGGTFDVGAWIKLGTVVYLRGLLKTTAAIAAGSLIMTMPTGAGMAVFASNGSMFTGIQVGQGTSAAFPMRLRLSGYNFVYDGPTTTSIPSGASIGLTGICYPADI